MSKKVNCRHGLDGRQEIQARRVRLKLEQGESEVLANYKGFWEEWFVDPKTSFVEFLKNKDMVYYSAYLRAIQNQGMTTIYSKIANL